MREEVQRLINALREEAAMKERLAKDLADLADHYEWNGSHLRAQGMRNLSRHHRIRSMQAHAQISALASQYSQLIGKSL